MAKEIEEKPFFLNDAYVAVDPNLVFVLLPFKNTILFEKVIKSVVESKEIKLKCKKGDDFFTTGAIMQDIAESIRRASIIIADLSGRNANVFYELGLAHAFRKRVILLTQSDDDLPTDLKAQRYYKYSIETTEGIESLEILLKRILISLQDNSDLMLEENDTYDIRFSKGNEKRIDAAFLRQNEGTFLIWGLVSEEHDVLYPQKNNMYLIAHTTSTDGGSIKKEVERYNEEENKIEEQQIKFYPNVFAIRRIPKKQDNSVGAWGFVCGANDEKKQEIIYRYELDKGWHLFTVMWSSIQDFIKFYIDEEHVGTSTFRYWPEEQARHVFIGSWPGNRQAHWFDSSLGPWKIYRNPISIDELIREISNHKKN